MENRHPVSKPGASPHRPIAHSTTEHKAHEHTHEELPPEPEEGLLKILHAVIHFAVRVLAILMTLVILWGVADVVYVLYQRLIGPPFMLLTLSDLLALFGAFLAVLIAIEIFINITLYIRKDVLPVKMVVATALMAIARKVIVMDFKEIGALEALAIAAVILALGMTYWLVSLKPKTPHHEER